MNLLDIAKQRYSCRKYKQTPVSADALNYIKECVRMAPSAVNKQPWVFRVVTSPEGVDNVRKCYDREWFVTAPMYVVASVKHNEEWTRADGKSHGNIDVAIAAEHFCLAAAEKGLGTCWVCNFNAPLLHRLMGMNDTEEPVVIIPLGYPDCDLSPKNRKDADDVFVMV